MRTSYEWTKDEPDEAVRRLQEAEEILDGLASGYWQSVLNQASDGYPLMGYRVRDYWRHIEMRQWIDREDKLRDEAEQVSIWLNQDRTK